MVLLPVPAGAGLAADGMWGGVCDSCCWPPWRCRCDRFGGQVRGCAAGVRRYSCAWSRAANGPAAGRSARCCFSACRFAAACGGGGGRHRLDAVGRGRQEALRACKCVEGAFRLVGSAAGSKGGAQAGCKRPMRAPGPTCEVEVAPVEEAHGLGELRGAELMERKLARCCRRVCRPAVLCCMAWSPALLPATFLPSARKQHPDHARCSSRAACRRPAAGGGNRRRRLAPPPGLPPPPGRLGRAEAALRGAKWWMRGGSRTGELHAPVRPGRRWRRQQRQPAAAAASLHRLPPPFPLLLAPLQLHVARLLRVAVRIRCSGGRRG